MQRHLLIVSGPSGAGKGTLIKKLLSECPHLTRVVCLTTRAPRLDEHDGEQFHFVSSTEFNNLASSGALAAFSSTYGEYYYGVEHHAIAMLPRDVVPILELDFDAMQQISGTYDVTKVLVIAPSLDDAHKRLVLRGIHDSDEVERRLLGSRRFLENAPVYDFIIVNDCFDPALAEMIAVVQMEYLRLIHAKRLMVIKQELDELTTRQRTLYSPD